MRELWDCSRALALWSDQIICYELAPFPTSLFDESGNMHDMFTHRRIYYSYTTIGVVPPETSLAHYYVYGMELCWHLLS